MQTKNLYLASRKDSGLGGPGEGDYGLTETSASASSSTSDTDVVFEQQMREPFAKRRESNSTTVKGILRPSFNTCNRELKMGFHRTEG